jgi:RNA methyltransferase, TrmH family
MIESLQNPKVKQARALRRRRERLREGKLFVEGLRLVRDALLGGTSPELLFYTRPSLAQPEVLALVEQHRQVAWEVSESILSEMAETVTPQGVAAVVPLPALPWPARPSLLLVADRLRDPGNLGTLLRSAAAAGVEGVIAPKGTVDPWSDKVLRAGMGAHFRVPVRENIEWPQVLPLLAGLQVYLAEAGSAVVYDEVDWRVPCALVVGGEARGAGDAAMRRADRLVSIPMAREVESLNAAVAGSVILFEAFRQRRS